MTASLMVEDEYDRYDSVGLAGLIASGELAPADLIETVCDRIVTMVLSLERVKATRVTIHRPQAPIAVPFAGVSVSRRREAEDR